jgi:DNA-binding transcriptional ArsR family regulator/DNA gyrase inhibitor GyrI
MDVDTEELVTLLLESGKDVALILGAFANENRLHIGMALLPGETTFRKLQNLTTLGKTALAHHLDLLIKAGMITRAGRGRYQLTADGEAFLRAIGTVYSDSKRRKKIKAKKQAEYIQKIHTKEVKPMKEFNVKVVTLEPMRVASSQVISESPEKDAWEKMRTWAEPIGLLQDLDEHPVYGFNNPNPSPGQTEYGYEFWIKVGPDITAGKEIEIKEVDGGLYAVTTCNLKQELESEFFKKNGVLESWHKIVEWVESSEYTMGGHQCLEKAHNPDTSVDEMILDLYCPIVKE